MGSLHEPPSSSPTARSESGGGPHVYCDCSSCRLRRAEDAERKIRVLEAQLGVLQTLAESRGDEAMLIILRAGR